LREAKTTVTRSFVRTVDHRGMEIRTGDGRETINNPSSGFG
jgi:hypothetical protein